MPKHAENVRSRKWLLTINNPKEYGLSHDNINSLMKQFHWIYYCLADEIGGKNNTYHTHLYFVCNNAVGFDKVKRLFPSAHIDKALGSSSDNRDYILKEGKHADNSITSVEGTFEEYGELPLDKSERESTVSAAVLNMIQQGFSNAEIISAYPSYINKIPHLEETRNVLKEEEFNNVFRIIEVVYIFGDSGTGKTRYVMDTYGYKNVYKVTNYQHPFDTYRGQDVLLLDEFRSSLFFNDLLQITDGYPCKLTARYNDKTACFTKVFIVSNIDLKEQYPEVQKDPKTWNAFIRRINKVFLYELTIKTENETEKKETETNIITINPDSYKL